MGNRKTKKPADWTLDPRTGRCNSSVEFMRLRNEVGRLIRDSAHDLIVGRAEDVGGLIMAQLAHVHGLRLPARRKAR